jgi:hypothetical protein
VREETTTLPPDPLLFHIVALQSHHLILPASTRREHE